MKKKISCAVAGTGRIGSSLEDDRKREKPASHAGAISRNGNTSLIAGCDSDAEALSSFGVRWNISPEHLYQSLSKMIENEKIEILHIATSTESHIDNLRTALAFRLPVIILEKPVAETLTEGESVLSEIKAAGTKIIVNHERRFSADYAYAKGISDQKVYGALLSLSARLFIGKTKRVKDVLWHDGTHMIDIIRYLTGSDITPVSVYGNPWSKEGNVFLIGRAGICDVVLECSPGRDHLQFELDLSFESGRLRIGNGIFEETESRISPYYETYRSLLPVKTHFPKGKNGCIRTGYFENMMAHAVEVYTYRQTAVVSSFEDGLASIRTIQAFLDMSGYGETEG